MGQHFLKNKKILAEIAGAAELTGRDAVLEVGSGHGELTEFLAERAGKVIAVEKDRELATWLMKHKTWKNVEIVQGDILKNASRFKFHDSGFKIVANLPYYLTSHFLRTFLEAKNKPKLMVLMVQYEVAKRILVKPPQMNLLALSVQAYSKPEFVRKVSKNNFAPPPKVDSAIIKLANIECLPIPKKFWEIARRAFQQKRKMLRHSLKNLSLPEKYRNKRPQELSLADWKKIYSNIY